VNGAATPRSTRAKGAVVGTDVRVYICKQLRNGEGKGKDKSKGR
jgi:hypothetical protein